MRVRDGGGPPEPLPTAFGASVALPACGSYVPVRASGTSSAAGTASGTGWACGVAPGGTSPPWTVPTLREPFGARLSPACCAFVSSETGGRFAPLSGITLAGGVSAPGGAFAVAAGAGRAAGAAVVPPGAAALAPVSSAAPVPPVRPRTPLSSAIVAPPLASRAPALYSATPNSLRRNPWRRSIIRNSGAMIASSGLMSFTPLERSRAIAFSIDSTARPSETSAFAPRARNGATSPSHAPILAIAFPMPSLKMSSRRLLMIAPMACPTSYPSFDQGVLNQTLRRRVAFDVRKLKTPLRSSSVVVVSACAALASVFSAVDPCRRTAPPPGSPPCAQPRRQRPPRAGPSWTAAGTAPPDP